MTVLPRFQKPARAGRRPRLLPFILALWAALNSVALAWRALSGVGVLPSALALTTVLSGVRALTAALGTLERPELLWHAALYGALCLLAGKATSRAVALGAVALGDDRE